MFQITGVKDGANDTPEEPHAAQDDTHQSDHQVYEADGIRSGPIDWTGEVLTTEVIESDEEAQMLALVGELSESWRSRIKLYRVPFVNTTSTSSMNL
jgi:hypothetical protein